MSASTSNPANHTPTPSDEKVPLKTKVGWGMGGVADNLIPNTFNALALPIFNIAFGLEAALVGIAIAIPRLLDAFSDILIGNFSDNTRTRWGRRRPFIVGGAILSALILPFIWLPPSMSTWALFTYLTLMGTLYMSFSYTFYVVPYTALGYELTGNYDERTKVLAWRMYVGLVAGLAIPWIYKLCFLDVFGGNEATGAFYISIVIAAIIIVSGIIPAITCKENPEAAKQEPIHFKEAITQTIKNKPFLALIGIYIFIISGLFTSAAFGLYINIYYICEGDKSFAATISGLSGMCVVIAAYASIFLTTYISTRWSKRIAMMTALGIYFIGAATYNFTLSPEHPYLQLVSYIIIGLGMQGVWLMVSSMVGDICDEDERITHLRREGTYSAVISFALKASLALASVLSGFLLSVSGYNAKIAESVGVTEDVVNTMLVLFISLQMATPLIAMALFKFYPLTRARAEETRRILEARKAAQAEA